MLQFIIVGLVLGSIYALAASGLVITYVSTGVLNFAFGSLAYFIARIYYCLHIEKELGHPPAGVRCASSVLAAAHGYASSTSAIFRFLRLSSQLIKVVVTIGLVGGRSRRSANDHLRQRRDLPGPGPRAAAGAPCTSASAPPSPSTR